MQVSDEPAPTRNTNAAASLPLSDQRSADRRMCLCGMLAAAYPTLPDAMRASVVRFFDQNETWLDRVLEQDRSDGSLHAPGPHVTAPL
jgi:hypothetical protein